MKITPEMFGLTKEDVAKFEKQDERLAALRQELVRVELPKPKITHYGAKGAFQAMIDVLEEKEQPPELPRGRKAKPGKKGRK